MYTSSLCQCMHSCKDDEDVDDDNNDDAVLLCYT